ncbi:MAG: nucleotide exchange factor GrpE [Flavobacteriaceae bacterium]|nr:nucleotide exchange factor GrpE [Flavobacteriaceae bacterium]
MSKSKNSEKNPIDSTDNHEIESNEVEQPAAEDTAKQENAEPTIEEQLAQEKDKFLRLFAEFENYKKRTTKERIDLFKTAGREVITALLPVLDDFDRALPEIKKSADADTLKGIELIQNKFKEVLKSKGLTEISVEAGSEFDSEVHDAITQIPAPEEKLKGKIIDTVEKGYTLGDQIIRHPKVVVGQ